MNKTSKFLKQNKIVFIVLFIVLVGALFYLFFPKIKYFGLEKFSSDEYGINFLLPKNWKEIKANDLKRFNEAAKLGFTKTNSPNTSFIIKIDDSLGKQYLDMQKIIPNLKNIFSKELEDFELINIQESMFHNLPCIEVEYTYSLRTDISGGKQTTHQKQIIFLKDEKLYWLIFASYPEDFNNDSKDLDTILDEFTTK